MVIRLWFFLMGHLKLRVAGDMPEKLVNLAVSEGIFLWDLRTVEDELFLSIGISGFRRLRPLVRKSRTRVRIVEKRGWPFALRHARKRRVLLAGALLFFLALYIVSSFIWFIEVKTDDLEQLSEDTILKTVARYGLTQGAWKGNVDFKKIARRLTLDLEEVAWASLTLRGTKVTIEVIENTLPPDEGILGPADIVSAKDGLVTDLFVLRGNARVKPGDTVMEGQVLIGGRLEAGDSAIAGAVPGQPLLVQAKGRVKARVWYDTYREVPLLKTVRVRTGETFTRQAIKIGTRRTILAGAGPVPFASYDKVERVKALNLWRNLNIPVEVETTVYHETISFENLISPAVAEREAIREARNDLMARIPLDAQIVSVRSDLVQTGKDFVGVHVLIETIEEIGQVRPINTKTGGDAQFESSWVAAAQGADS